MTDETYRNLASAVLVAHQRYDASSCLCGWSELGQSWADHVAAVLDAAGALRDRPPAGERTDVRRVTHYVLTSGGSVPEDISRAIDRLIRAWP